MTLVEVMYPARIAKPGGRPKKGDPAGDPTNAIIRVFAVQKRVMQKEYKTSYLCDISEGDFWHSGLCQTVFKCPGLGHVSLCEQLNSAEETETCVLEHFSHRTLK